MMDTPSWQAIVFRSDNLFKDVAVVSAATCMFLIVLATVEVAYPLVGLWFRSFHRGHRIIFGGLPLDTPRQPAAPSNLLLGVHCPEWCPEIDE